MTLYMNNTLGVMHKRYPHHEGTKTECGQGRGRFSLCRCPQHDRIPADFRNCQQLLLMNCIFSIWCSVVTVVCTT